MAQTTIAKIDSVAYPFSEKAVFQKQQRQGVLAKRSQDNELDLLEIRDGAQFRIEVDFFTCQSEKYDPIQTYLFIHLPQCIHK